MITNSLLKEPSLILLNSIKIELKINLFNNPNSLSKTIKIFKI